MVNVPSKETPPGNDRGDLYKKEQAGKKSRVLRCKLGLKRSECDDAKNGMDCKACASLYTGADMEKVVWK